MKPLTPAEAVVELAGLDVDADALSREELAERLHEAVSIGMRLAIDCGHATDNLTAVQKRCTELLSDSRVRAAAVDLFNERGVCAAPRESWWRLGALLFGEHDPRVLELARSTS